MTVDASLGYQDLRAQHRELRAQHDVLRSQVRARDFGQFQSHELVEANEQLFATNTQLRMANAQVRETTAQLYMANEQLFAANGKLLAANMQLHMANAQVCETTGQLLAANVRLRGANVRTHGDVIAIRNQGRLLLRENEQLRYQLGELHLRRQPSLRDVSGSGSTEAHPVTGCSSQ